MKELELPVTLRVPQINEIIDNPEMAEQLEKRKTANIVEGYVLHQKNNNPNLADLGFKFYAEINIDNSNLWNLTLALTNEMPETIAVVFGTEDSELNYGKYSDKEKTITFLSQYSKEFSADTFIELGLIFHDENQLIEVLIDRSKYIKFWGIDENRFTEIMKDFNLPLVEDLEFVDQYPKVREVLGMFDITTTKTEDLVKILEEEFL